jgi:hypothetical protein
MLNQQYTKKRKAEFQKYSSGTGSIFHSQTRGKHVGEKRLP